MDKSDGFQGHANNVRLKVMHDEQCFHVQIYFAWSFSITQAEEVYHQLNFLHDTQAVKRKPFRAYNSLYNCIFLHF